MSQVPIATIRTQDDLIEALRAAKALRGLSNEFCDERGGMTKGHTDKAIGPARTKGLSPMVFDTLTTLFAVKLLMVVDDETEHAMREKWEGRDLSNVRIEPSRISAKLLERAKPHVLSIFSKRGVEVRLSMQTAEQRKEIARKAARARWNRTGRKKTKTARNKRVWYRKKRQREDNKQAQPVEIQNGKSQ